MFKAVLFDADGVLNLNEAQDYFSVVYAREKGINPGALETFFKRHWDSALTGKADLIQLIQTNQNIWQWDEDVQKLIDWWFESEDKPNQELLSLVAELRKNGTPCYLLTNQEKYRGEYMKKVFGDKLDGIFVSADLGVMKPDLGFFHKVLEKLQPQDIAYFDDSPGHVRAAKALGIAAYLYESPEQVRQIVQ